MMVLVSQIGDYEAERTRVLLSHFLLPKDNPQYLIKNS